MDKVWKTWISMQLNAYKWVAFIVYLLYAGIMSQMQDISSSRGKFRSVLEQ